VAPLDAQRSNLKQALPAGTIAFFALPDIGKSIDELFTMPMLRMWQQEELQRVLAPALAELEKQWRDGLKQAEALHEQGKVPFSPQDLLELRLFGATAALTHVALKGDTDPVPDIGIVVHLDFGPSAPTWRKLIDFGLAELERVGDDLVRTETEVGGVKLTTWQPPDIPMGLNLAWVGDGVVVGTVQSEVSGVLEALQAQRKVLTADNSYKAVAAKVETSGSELEFFFDFQQAYRAAFGILELAEAHAPDFPPQLSVTGLDRALDALGLKAIKAMGATCTYQDGKAVTKSYVVCPAPERKGLVADGSKNLDLSCLGWVPKKATSCSAMTINLTALFDAFVGAFNAYDPDLAKEALAQLGAIEQQVGFTVRDDLCGAFGDQMLTWSLPFQGIPGLSGGSPINALVLFQMKDKDRLLKCLNGLEEVSQGKLEFDSNTRDDTTTYYVKLNVDLGSDLPFNPLDMIQPVFGFQNGYMVLGFSRADVRKTMTAMAAEKPEAETIRGNQAFADMLSKLDQERLTAVSFSDNRATFDNVYELLYGLSAMVPEDFPVDVKELPDEGAFLSQHLFPSVSHSHTDGTGFANVSVGPFGPELGVVIGVVLGGVGVGAAFAQQRGMMRRR
jgi:hypothetical protein